MNHIDLVRMREALTIAQNSVVRVSPNPKVGCVIYNTLGEKIGQGVTSPPGGFHAEQNALSQARELGHSLDGSTAYVTLEPCAHTGRTGPCVEALIKAKVSRVCLGVRDPNPLVGGRGVQRLTQAGIQVEEGVLKEECNTHHAPFFKWITKGIPWVSLKGAMTLDGCLATASGHSNWITGIEARTHVHRLRARVDAMMVGGETARRDRPSLTVRHCEGSDPTSIAISRRLSIPNDAPFLRENTILFHGAQASIERQSQLIDLGVTLVELPSDQQSKGLDLNVALDYLGRQGITHLCVEGGGQLHGAFLNANLADDLHLYIAPKLIGRGKPLFNFPSVQSINDGLELQNIATQQLGSDMYLYGLFEKNHLDKS